MSYSTSRGATRSSRSRRNAQNSGGASADHIDEPRVAPHRIRHPGRQRPRCGCRAQFDCCRAEAAAGTATLDEVAANEVQDGVSLVVGRATKL